MKVGSLVECIKHSSGQILVNGIWIPCLPERHVGYIGVVSDLVPPNHIDGPGILLEDDPHYIHPLIGELVARDPLKWKEIQPPMDISEILKESINEPVTA